MANFRDATRDLLNKIETNQITFPLINKKLQVRKVIVHKNFSFYYQIDSDFKIAYIITFFNNRMGS